MANDFKISPVRVGVNYTSQYRNTIEGARKAAAKSLNDAVLQPDLVVIKKRHDVRELGMRPYSTWNFYEARRLVKLESTLLAKAELGMDAWKSLIRRAR